MVERTPFMDFVAYAVLIVGVITMLAPLYLIFTTATVTSEHIYTEGLALVPGTHFLENINEVFERTELARQMFNSFIVAVIVVIGKMFLASITAFAIVFFNSPYKGAIFWFVLITLMLPLEVRIVPTYEIAANALLPFQQILEWTGMAHIVNSLFGIEINLDWNLLDTYTGLTLPLIATATGTFLFRQFYQTVPPELVEAARMDGAGPIRFFFDILLPLSKTNFAALGTLVFIGAWNSYLWPLLITTDEKMRTAVVGVASLNATAFDQLPEWNISMAAALIVLLPPVLVIALMQRWFIKGLMGH